MKLSILFGILAVALLVLWFNSGGNDKLFIAGFICICIANILIPTRKPLHLISQTRTFRTLEYLRKI